jgi:hypothetical protein
MTLKQYLVVMSAGTLLAGAAVAMVLMTVDPTDTQSIVFAALYICLFLALTGLLSIIGFLLRVWLLRKDVLSRQVLVAFRQAVLLSAVMVTALILQSRSLLNWFNAALIVAALTLLEFFFITAKIMR